MRASHPMHQQIVHTRLVLQRHQCNDVAGGRQIVRGVEKRRQAGLILGRLTRRRIAWMQWIDQRHVVSVVHLSARLDGELGASAHGCSGGPRELIHYGRPRSHCGALGRLVRNGHNRRAAALEDAGGGRGGGPAGIAGGPGSLRVVCGQLEGLIAQAYLTFANGEARYDRFARPPVRGGPAWIEKERYTINAKPGSAQSFGMMHGP